MPKKQSRRLAWNFATNLNEVAWSKVILIRQIGRDKELERTIQVPVVAAVRTNPLYWLVKGVGKTAIAEGLAWRNAGRTGFEIIQKAVI